MSTKLCLGCKVTKPIEYFDEYPVGSGNTYIWCKACRANHPNPIPVTTRVLSREEVLAHKLEVKQGVVRAKGGCKHCG